MTEQKKFILITFLTLVALNISRVIGWKYFSRTALWQQIVYDDLHHYQFGILLLVIVFFVKKLGTLRTIILAIGSGMIIDESMYLLYDINTNFSHGTITGVIFEFVVFFIVSAIVLKHEDLKRLIGKNE